MTRLLYVSGDTELAKRTLRLYVQVVSKARVAGGEADSDRHWVETLVQGARMFCRAAVASTGLGGIKDAREAHDLIAKAQERLDRQDKEQSASVDLAEGICNLTLGLKGETAPYVPVPTCLKLCRTRFSDTPGTLFSVTYALPPIR
jgi:hypothetical protein